MSQVFVVNAPSMSQMHSLKVTEKACPGKMLNLSTVHLEQQNPSVLVAAIMDYVYVEGTKQNGA